MRCAAHFIMNVLMIAAGFSCDVWVTPNAGSNLLTDLSFTNLSRNDYAALAIRESSGLDSTAAYVQTPLLPPGAVFRQSFFDLIGAACPDALDVRLLIYKRINNDLPIGLDPGEAVGPTPIAAGQVLNVPACTTAVLGIYTIVNWDADLGTAKVKIGQSTDIEVALRSANRPEFDEQGVWQIAGIDPALSQIEPPTQLATKNIRGRVTLVDGTGLENIGVVLRSRFRIRDSDDNPDNDPDAGFGEPFIFTQTDTKGEFTLDRPPGTYEATFFADDFLFRPAGVILETPISVINIVAEPL